MDIRDSNYRHIKFIDLKNNGILEECAIMKQFDNGDIAFIPIGALDQTDKIRLHKIITTQHANMFELHELMQNTSLKNGMNALEYFQQLVKVVTASGQIITTSPTQRGAGTTRINQDHPTQISESNLLKKRKNLSSEIPTK